MSLSLAIVFWTSVVIALGVGILLYFPVFRTGNRPFLGLTAILVLSGAGLIALTLKQDIRGALRVFLLMTGAAPAGFLVSFLLHNAVYALSMVLFGKKTEETVFFLLAVAVCPLAFVVGAVGSVVLTIM